MKTSSLRKIFILLALVASIPALVVGGWLTLALRGLPDVAFLADPAANVTLTVKDWEGTTRSLVVGPYNPMWASFEEVSPHLRAAVRAGEDFSFYDHKGVDWFEVRASFIRNLKERRFARGASTITQQVAKNLFLTRDKTIRRKVLELALARRLEKALAKDRIFELYLNLAELGDGVYGVGAGARHHFSKAPADLTVRESAFLAAMLPGPRYFNPDTDPDRVAARADHILAVMLRGRMITGDEYQLALTKLPPAGDAGEEKTTHILPGERQLREVTLPSGERRGDPAGAAPPPLAVETPIVEIPITKPGEGLAKVKGF